MESYPYHLHTASFVCNIWCPVCPKKCSGIKVWKKEKNKIISELQLKVSNTWIGSLQAIIGLFVQNKNTFPSPAYLVQFWGKGIHAHQLGTVVSGEPFNFRVWRNKKVHMVSVGGSINQNWCQRFTRLWEQRTLATIQCLDLAIFSPGPQKTMKWSNGDKTNKVGCRKNMRTNNSNGCHDKW